MPVRPQKEKRASLICGPTSNGLRNGKKTRHRCLHRVPCRARHEAPGPGPGRPARGKTCTAMAGAACMADCPQGRGQRKASGVQQLMAGGQNGSVGRRKSQAHERVRNVEKGHLYGEQPSSVWPVVLPIMLEQVAIPDRLMKVPPCKTAAVSPSREHVRRARGRPAMSSARAAPDATRERQANPGTRVPRFPHVLHKRKDLS